MSISTYGWDDPQTHHGMFGAHAWRRRAASWLLLSRTHNLDTLAIKTQLKTNFLPFYGFFLSSYSGAFSFSLQCWHYESTGWSLHDTEFTFNLLPRSRVKKWLYKWKQIGGIHLLAVSSLSFILPRQKLFHYQPSYWTPPKIFLIPERLHYHFMSNLNLAQKFPQHTILALQGEAIHK